MSHYDIYSAEQAPPLLTRGWFVFALTVSLVVHAVLAIFLHFRKLENFGPSELPPAKIESTLHRVRIIDEKPKKPEEIRTVLPERKAPDKKKELTLPSELPAPDEIEVKPGHKEIDPSKLFAEEKPPIAMANLAPPPKTNLDDLAPKLPESFLNPERRGPKVVARKEGDPGPDGDGSARAIQVAGQDVEGILSGLTKGTGTSRRLSLPGNLTFGYDDAELSGEGRQELEKLAEAFRKFLGTDLQKSTFIIEGHTDPTGTPDYNQSLSERRAESVRAWFVANMNLNPEHVKTVGYGANRPVDGIPLNGTIEEMQGHRRTEIIVRRPKK